jgi:hypothetical protein
MRNNSSRSSLFIAPLLAAGLLAAAGGVQAQGGDIAPSLDTSSIYRRDTGIDSSGDYRHEVRACRSGRTQQDTETCLEEARNAHAAMQRGVLAKRGEDYTANALARCLPLLGEYRIACEARVMGFGNTSGSVAAGGLLREVETVVIPPGAQRVRIEARTPNAVLVAPAHPHGMR